MAAVGSNELIKKDVKQPLSDQLLLSLGFTDDNLDTLTDEELVTKLQPISTAWHHSESINLDEARTFCDKLDSVLQRYVHHHRCKLLDDRRYALECKHHRAVAELEQQAAIRWSKAEAKAVREGQPPSSYPLPDDAEKIKALKAKHPQPEQLTELLAAEVDPDEERAAQAGSPSREVVLTILRCHTLMLSHCQHSEIYESTDNIIYMLNTDDLEIMYAALHVLLALQLNAHSRNLTFQSFASRYEVKIRNQLMTLATQTFLPTLRKPAAATELMQEADDAHHAHANTVQTMMREHIDSAELSEQLDLIDLPVYAKPQQQSQPLTSQDTSQQQAATTALTYKDLKHVIQQADVKSIPDAVARLKEHYVLHMRDEYTVTQTLRFIQNATNPRARQQYTFIRFLAIQLSLTFATQRKETIATLSERDADLLDSLLDLLRQPNSEQTDAPIHVELKTAALSVLNGFLQSHNVRQQMKVLGALQTGVVLLLLRQSITPVKDMHAILARNEQLQVNMLAAHIRYVAALTHLLEKLVPKLAYESVGLSPIELVDSIISLIADTSITSMSVLGNAINMTEELVQHHGTPAIQKFHALNGLDGCFDRVQMLVRALELSTTHVPPVLHTIVPAVDFTPGHTNKQFIISPFWCSQSLLNGLLSLMAATTKRHRQPIKMQALRNGNYTATTTKLWQQALRPLPTASSSNLQHSPSYTSMDTSSSETDSSARTTTRRSAKGKRQRIDDLSSSGADTPPQKSPTLTSIQQSSLSLRSPTAAISSPPPASLLRWGEETWAFTSALVCAVAQNQPALLKEFHDDGLTSAFLAELNIDMLKHVHILRVVPETIRSLCLTPAGLDTVIQHNPLQLVLDIFLQIDDPKITKTLDRGMITLLSRGTDELFRHHAKFVPVGMQSIVRVIEKLIALADQLDKAEPAPNIDTIKRFNASVDRYGRFLDLILRHFHAEFRKTQGGESKQSGVDSTLR